MYWAPTWPDAWLGSLQEVNHAGFSQQSLWGQYSSCQCAHEQTSSDKLTYIFQGTLALSLIGKMSFVYNLRGHGTSKRWGIKAVYDMIFIQWRGRRKELSLSTYYIPSTRDYFTFLFNPYDKLMIQYFYLYMRTHTFWAGEEFVQGHKNKKDWSCDENVDWLTLDRMMLADECPELASDRRTGHHRNG